MVQALTLRRLLPALLLSAVFVAAPTQATEVVHLWYRNFDQPATLALLKLALDETRDLYGDYRIESSPQMSQARGIAEIEKGRHKRINAIDVATNPRREQRLLPIRVPTADGLLGYRVCLIATGTEGRFKGIKSFTDIRKRNLTFGQGVDWPDTEVLKANGLNVLTQVRFGNLFHMLAYKRFDCFPRSVTEIYYDLQTHPTEGISIEPSLLFTYPMPSFFFVNKENKALAARIELGLRRAMLNGRYKAYFENYIAPSLQKLNLSQRTVIRLNNPLLTAPTRRIVTESAISIDGKLQIY
ncbi:type 2 periplasmic-binding domain-containing protein [Mangrovitalea sediminis]|uniref:hypothetical protein n=1 Tax=Mangrovitalea sediminis TaxID=1982043 RepID=UPI000BE5F2E2|nr:hypothetical protein [Mangrovitalea sediminis]